MWFGRIYDIRRHTWLQFFAIMYAKCPWTGILAALRHGCRSPRQTFSSKKSKVRVTGYHILSPKPYPNMVSDKLN
jgi:hypothetical protein